MQVGSVNVIPQSANHMIVSLNGVIQKPGSSFTVSGSTITFASNLATGDVIDFIQILGDVLDLGTPSDATVTAAKLASTSITGQTAEATVADDDTVLIHDTSASALRKMTVSNLTANAGTAGLTSSSGNITITDGDLIFGGSGHGVYLGVTSATAANHLDDYEEGTWTPTFTHDGSAVSNVTINKANYTKVGRLVYVSMNARYTGSDLTGGNLIGAGLPFTSASENVLGVTGAYLHDPGSGSTNYDAGVAGSHDSNTNFFMIVTPGGRYQQRWLQNYYLSFACWYFV
jgi:hypothetical protein